MARGGDAGSCRNEARVSRAAVRRAVSGSPSGNPRLLHPAAPGIGCRGRRRRGVRRCLARLDEVPISEEAVRWLCGVSQRVVSNQWRSRRRRRRLTGRLGGLGSPPAETPEIQVVRSEEQEMVTRALSQLRWTDQEILRLATWERLPHSGIAELLDISEAAVGQRISRARKRLASEVERLDRGPRSQVPLPRKKAG